MTMNPLAIGSVMLLGLAGLLSAQESPAKTEKSAQGAVPPPPAIDQKVLEEKFTKMLTRATFTGRWCAVDKGQLGPEKDEKYTITGVNKVGNDLWLIHARVQYGNKDVTLPVPVYVKWAGDTPVISITDAALPGLGTYTARVVVYNNRYAGSWSGGRHEGMLHGVITQEKAEP